MSTASSMSGMSLALELTLSALAGVLKSKVY